MYEALDRQTGQAVALKVRRQPALVMPCGGRPCRSGVGGQQEGAESDGRTVRIGLPGVSSLVRHVMCQHAQAYAAVDVCRALCPQVLHVRNGKLAVPVKAVQREIELAGEGCRGEPPPGRLVLPTADRATLGQAASH